MATQVAKTSGKRTRHRRASRLRRKEPRDGGVVLKHRAAVLPAKNKVIKDIAAKAVDEWPEGNDRRPSRIWSISLCCVNDDLMDNDLHTDPVHTCCEASHSHRDRKSGRSRPKTNTSVRMRSWSRYIILRFTDAILQGVSDQAA